MHSPDVCGDCWFLRRVLRILVKEHKHLVLMERYIRKEYLFRRLSWWFRLSKEDSKHVLRLLARNFDGVVYKNAGLHIPKSYLPGGETNEVGA